MANSNVKRMEVEDLMKSIASVAASAGEKTELLRSIIRTFYGKVSAALLCDTLGIDADRYNELRQ